ncbi:Uncharacterised protein [Fusobacterium necrogenes]|uniref:Uncharacterized protein n=1 Tax=Fusobacterium necrogenes TaxID=858 RepID=A0A377GXW5_9FUSO|nr:hypothetical protein [Fusobacterium necrogenes]STO31840.1 Uncharacterised protein [Fusobacterium necrogenes]
MKKFILIYMLTYIFSYANYLISNSEIVLFYDESYSSVHYVRGDIFQGIDISKIEGKLILDGKDVISINQYFENATLISQTNILKLNYNINGKYLTVNIIPSMIEKDKLYFIVEFVNFLKDNRQVDFAFRIAPQYDNRYIEYNFEKDSYKYDNFYFKSENYSGKSYIARDGIIEDLVLEPVEERTKKYQDDNLYYMIKDIDYNKPIEFVIKFYGDFKEKRDRQNSTVLANEIEYWEKFNGDKKFINKRIEALNQIRNLEIMTSRIVVPNQISYNKSEESLNTKIKLYYLDSLYDSEFNPNKMLEDLYSKKNDNQKVVYYNFLFKYLNRSGNYINKEILSGKIIPEILTLLEHLDNENDKISEIRDNINNYYWYYELIENIENREEFLDKKEFLLERKNILLNYLNNYFVTEDGIKIRKEYKKSYYKNIKFIGFLPKERQKEILKKDYKKYYNKLYGLLKENNEKKIDLSYNLNFIIKLYENDEKYLADILFANLDTYIKKNSYYINPTIYPDKANPAGIYGELLYLYFVAVEHKESYGNRK